MATRVHRKPKSRKGRKASSRLNALSKLDRIFDKIRKSVLSKILLWKIGKDRLNKKRQPKLSKVCAGITCTPCEGFATPSTPHAVGNGHARRKS